MTTRCEIPGRNVPQERPTGSTPQANVTHVVARGFNQLGVNDHFWQEGCILGIELSSELLVDGIEGHTGRRTLS